MSMSKKDFIALADALRAERPASNWSLNKMAQWELDVRAVADACEAANPRFNRELWMDYVCGLCGPSGGKL